MSAQSKRRRSRNYPDGNLVAILEGEKQAINHWLEIVQEEAELEGVAWVACDYRAHVLYGGGQDDRVRLIAAIVLCGPLFQGLILDIIRS